MCTGNHRTSNLGLRTISWHDEDTYFGQQVQTVDEGLSFLKNQIESFVPKAFARTFAVHCEIESALLPQLAQIVSFRPVPLYLSLPPSSPPLPLYALLCSFGAPRLFLLFQPQPLSLLCVYLVFSLSLFPFKAAPGLCAERERTERWAGFVGHCYRKKLNSF